MLMNANEDYSGSRRPFSPNSQTRKLFQWSGTDDRLTDGRKEDVNRKYAC